MIVFERSKNVDNSNRFCAQIGVELPPSSIVSNLSELLKVSERSNLEVDTARMGPDRIMKELK